MSADVVTKACPDCGHHHAGRSLAGICVGCPCETRDVAGTIAHARFCPNQVCRFVERTLWEATA